MHGNVSRAQAVDMCKMVSSPLCSCVASPLFPGASIVHLFVFRSLIETVSSKWCVFLLHVCIAGLSSFFSSDPLRTWLPPSLPPSLRPSLPRSLPRPSADSL